MIYRVYLNYVTDFARAATIAAGEAIAVESEERAAYAPCWSGDILLWTSIDPDTEDAILDPKLSLELDSAGSFTFSVIPNHKHYDHFNRMTSLVKVTCDDTTLFVGRVLNIETDLWRTRKVTCEGLLAVLNDSLQSPESSNSTLTAEARFDSLVNMHNAQMSGLSIFKRLHVGNVTIDDRLTQDKYKSGSYRSIYDAVDNDLIKNYGGYLKLRVTQETVSWEEDGETKNRDVDVYYVDYLKDYGDENAQRITFGNNLIEFTEGSSGENLFTALIPVGDNNKKISSATQSEIDAALEPYNTTIIVDEESQTYNPYQITGVEIGNKDLIRQYGYIVKTQSFSGVTQMPELLTRSLKFFNANALGTTDSYTVKAVDLHLLDSESELLKIGDKITFQSNPHGINRQLTITGVEYDLIAPGNTSYDLGTPTQDLSFSKASTTSSGSGGGGGGYYGGSSFNPDSITTLNNIQYIRAREGVIHTLTGGDATAQGTNGDWDPDGSSLAFGTGTFTNLNVNGELKLKYVASAAGATLLGTVAPVTVWVGDSSDVSLTMIPHILTVGSGNVTEYSLNHSHRISESNGTVTIGAAVPTDSNERSFNIADTAFYQAAVSAAGTVHHFALSLADDSPVVYPSSTGFDGYADINLTAHAYKDTSYEDDGETITEYTEMLGSPQTTSISVDVSDVYDAGETAGIATGRGEGASAFAAYLQSSNWNTWSYNQDDGVYELSGSVTVYGRQYSSTVLTSGGSGAGTPWGDGRISGMSAAINGATLSQVVRDSNSTTGYSATLSYIYGGATYSKTIEVDVSGISSSATHSDIVVNSVATRLSQPSATHFGTLERAITAHYSDSVTDEYILFAAQMSWESSSDDSQKKWYYLHLPEP